MASGSSKFAHFCTPFTPVLNCIPIRGKREILYGRNRKEREGRDGGMREERYRLEGKGVGGKEARSFSTHFCTPFPFSIEYLAWTREMTKRRKERKKRGRTEREKVGRERRKGEGAIKKTENVL